MNLFDLFETTTSGSIAPVAAPLGGTQKRAGSLFKGKKTKKPFFEGPVVPFEPSTGHFQHSKNCKTKSKECDRHDLAFGGGCYNCGWDPNKLGKLGAKKEVDETRRMSAQEKLSRAFDRERAKSQRTLDISKRERDAIMAKWEKEKAERKAQTSPPETISELDSDGHTGSRDDLATDMKRPQITVGPKALQTPNKAIKDAAKILIKQLAPKKKSVTENGLDKRTQEAIRLRMKARQIGPGPEADRLNKMAAQYEYYVANSKKTLGTTQSGVQEATGSLGPAQTEKYKDIFGQESYKGKNYRVVVLRKEKIIVMGVINMDLGPAALDRAIDKLPYESFKSAFPGFKVYRTSTGYGPNRVTTTKGLIPLNLPKLMDDSQPTFQDKAEDAYSNQIEKNDAIPIDEITDKQKAEAEYTQKLRQGRAGTPSTPHSSINTKKKKKSGFFGGAGPGAAAAWSGGSITEESIQEDELAENDVVLAPGKGSKFRSDLISKKKSGPLAKFAPPYKATGLWISDRRGNRVSECESAEIAAEIVKLMNTPVDEATSGAKKPTPYRPWTEPKLTTDKQSQKLNPEAWKKAYGEDVNNRPNPKIIHINKYYVVDFQKFMRSQLPGAMYNVREIKKYDSTGFDFTNAPDAAYALAKEFDDTWNRDGYGGKFIQGVKEASDDYYKPRYDFTGTQRDVPPSLGAHIRKRTISVDGASYGFVKKDDRYWIYQSHELIGPVTPGPNKKVTSEYLRYLIKELIRTNPYIKEGKWYDNPLAVVKYHNIMREGAKVDRMVKHIAKSEKGLGHSKKDAENIAWATANKRGYLDNKNKKKK